MRLRWLLLALLILPACEIGVFVWIGGKIGPLWVVFLILFTGVIGITIAKMQGTQTIQKARLSMNSGKIPTEQIMDGICILIGAVFLLSPGFITDAIGLSLVLPIMRKPIKKILYNLIKSKMDNGTFIFRRW
ncbi:FxsA family protein [Oceanobacillus sp. Castelsardo]|uniref:FxsA family protein n=1 Tax=Oceanobacillus sp. Castelsardo TaxID=1851204 RepID=UPI000838B2AC|nr:FxsA family protein [Oceanobacillus sp. Castelsardo]